jgi:hypothetical protein
VNEVLTVTYTMGRRAVAVRPYRLYYATVLVADPRDFTAPLSVVASVPDSSAVRVVDAYGDDNGSRCAGGETSTAKGGRVVTQAVPFSCLAVFEHARLMSAVGFEHRDGGDAAYDRARRTRELPLTAYVPPAD